MTETKIKEYIDACIEHLRNIDYFEHIRMFIGTLEKINSMLDKLEDRPNAHWVIDEYGDYHCEKCNAIIEKDEWERHNYNYCYHCGARMEVEDEL